MTNREIDELETAWKQAAEEAFESFRSAHRERAYQVEGEIAEKCAEQVQEALNLSLQQFDAFAAVARDKLRTGRSSRNFQIRLVIYSGVLGYLLGRGIELLIESIK